jgi:chaperonin GroES
MKEIKYKPIGDRVVVDILKRNDEKTSGGLYKPTTASEAMIGVVVSVGDGLYSMSGTKIPMTVKVGDTVLLDGTGFKHKHGNTTYHIFRENELLSIIENYN